ncbi:hypothetical protein PAMP_007750 [Pampus punctatissimus]
MNRKIKVLTSLLCATSICLLLWGSVSEFPQLHYTNPCADDPSFVHCFNKTDEPFLSANHDISEDTFKWWKRLQSESCSYSAYRTTVDRLLQMFPLRPTLTKSSSGRYRTCAVVGNSANLKGSHYGTMIDLHDVVIRMNSSPIKGYEADVGIKTTHRIMYPESAIDLDNTTHLVLFPFKILDLEWVIGALSTGFSGVSYAPIKSTIKANKDLVMVISPGFMKYVHEIWLSRKGRYPSTGFMAVILALHICDNVHVFGYGADKDGNWSHYWETLTNKKLRTGLHPGSQEYDIILQLAKKQKIKFHSLSLSAGIEKS